MTDGATKRAEHQEYLEAQQEAAQYYTRLAAKALDRVQARLRRGFDPESTFSCGPAYVFSLDGHLRPEWFVRSWVRRG
jgi:hypothetical protein